MLSTYTWHHFLWEFTIIALFAHIYFSSIFIQHFVVHHLIALLYDSAAPLLHQISHPSNQSRSCTGPSRGGGCNFLLPALPLSDPALGFPSSLPTIELALRWGRPTGSHWQREGQLLQAFPWHPVPVIWHSSPPAKVKTFSHRICCLNNNRDDVSRRARKEKQLLRNYKLQQDHNVLTCLCTEHVEGLGVSGKCWSQRWPDRTCQYFVYLSHHPEFLRLPTH